MRVLRGFLLLLLGIAAVISVTVLGSLAVALIVYLLSLLAQ